MMVDNRFRYFVIFAEMRTGSNFLEQNINQFSDLHCYGELFNAQFIGDAKGQSLMDVSLEEREADPDVLIEKIRAKDENVIPGFRFFFDHDPRVLKSCMEDKSCAKIILNRNPLDTYVSRKIAGKTGQWKLTDLKDQKTARITFSAKEFESHLETAQGFQVRLQRGLQASGQAAFYINYDDINSLEVLNGMASFIGSSDTANALKTNLKKQNPSSLQSKVVNYGEMEVALGKIDFLNLSRTPDFEPRRGAGVPGYVACTEAPLLFMPIKGAPGDLVLNWMAAHNGTSALDLVQDFNQKSLRQWRRQHKGYHSFSIVRHPLERAHDSFCRNILDANSNEFRDIRNVLIQNYGLHLPESGPDDTAYDRDKHKAVFTDFLVFLKGNLSGQTRIRVDPSWASQTAVLQGYSTIAPVGMIIREQDIAQSLGHIESMLGLDHKAITAPDDAALPFQLSDIYDEDIEGKARKIYQRDYLHFGYGAWGNQ